MNAYTSIFFACIDKIVSELDVRFAIGCNVLKYVSALNPSSKHFLCPDTINELVKLYPRSGIDEFILNNLSAANPFYNHVNKTIRILIFSDFNLRSGVGSGNDKQKKVQLIGNLGPMSAPRFL